MIMIIKGEKYMENGLMEVKVREKENQMWEAFSCGDLSLSIAYSI